MIKIVFILLAVSMLKVRAGIYQTYKDLHCQQVSSQIYDGDVNIQLEDFIFWETFNFEVSNLHDSNCIEAKIYDDQNKELNYKKDIIDDTKVIYGIRRFNKQDFCSNNICQFKLTLYTKYSIQRNFDVQYYTGKKIKDKFILSQNVQWTDKCQDDKFPLLSSELGDIQNQYTLNQCQDETFQIHSSEVYPEIQLFTTPSFKNHLGYRPYSHGSNIYASVKVNRQSNQWVKLKILGLTLNDQKVEYNSEQQDSGDLQLIVYTDYNIRQATLSLELEVTIL